MRPAVRSWIPQTLAGMALALAVNAGLSLSVAAQKPAAQAPPPAVSGDKCSPGFTGSPETGCLDVNECAVENGGCSRFARCQNVPGSRTCGSCPDGYAGDGYLGCFDVNDCPAGDCSSKIPAVPPNDQPPAVTSTGDVTVAATSEAGATAAFKATAKDNVDGTIQAFCSPRAGSTFKVGKTTVTCWAYNTRGEIGRTTLTVTVTPPAIP